MGNEVLSSEKEVLFYGKVDWEKTTYRAKKQTGRKLVFVGERERAVRRKRPWVGEGVSGWAKKALAGRHHRALGSAEKGGGESWAGGAADTTSYS